MHLLAPRVLAAAVAVEEAYTFPPANWTISPLDFTADQLVGNSLAIIGGNFYYGYRGTTIFKGEREGFTIQQVMAVGGQLLQVEAAKRQVGAANSLTVLIHRNDFQKPVCRNHGTIRCGDVLLGIEAKDVYKRQSVSRRLNHVVCVSSFTGGRFAIFLTYLSNDAALRCRDLTG